MHFIPDRTRLMPTANSINIILKNTHFPDDALQNTHGIKLKVRNISGIPVLIFRFANSSYDFPEPLNYYRLKNSENGWLDKDEIVVKLQLADAVISDQMYEREFTLSASESEAIRSSFEQQKTQTPAETTTAENEVYARFLHLSD